MYLPIAAQTVRQTDTLSTAVVESVSVLELNSSEIAGVWKKEHDVFEVYY